LLAEHVSYAVPTIAGHYSNASNALRLQRVDLMLEEGLAGNVKQTFGPVLRIRPQAEALPGGQNNGVTDRGHDGSLYVRGVTIAMTWWRLEGRHWEVRQTGYEHTPYTAKKSKPFFLAS
jgi:hypothetical protein